MSIWKIKALSVCDKKFSRPWAKTMFTFFYESDPSDVPIQYIIKGIIKCTYAMCYMDSCLRTSFDSFGYLYCHFISVEHLCCSLGFFRGWKCNKTIAFRSSIIKCQENIYNFPNGRKTLFYILMCAVVR